MGGGGLKAGHLREGVEEDSLKNAGQLSPAEQNSAGLDAGAKKLALIVGVDHLTVERAVGHFKLHHVACFQLERQIDGNAGIGYVRYATQGGMPLVAKYGNSCLELNFKALCGSAFHSKVIGWRRG
jgi:hypothetical protein